ncbi:cell-cell signaling protein, partial [archaeon]
MERNTVDKVVATARDPEKAAELMKFTQTYADDRLVILPLDVTDQTSQ